MADLGYSPNSDPTKVLQAASDAQTVITTIFPISNSISVNVCPIPAVTNPATGQIQANWTGDVSKQYNTYLYSDAGGTSQVGGTGATTINGNPAKTWTWFSLTPGNTYYVRIREAGSGTSCTLYSITIT